VTTFAPGRPGARAEAAATDDLRAAAPREVQGVEHGDVPEEYREQVRKYFSEQR
jgi:hypothetical protein